MKIRNSLYIAVIVGAFTVFAPVYGPQIGARAATNPQDDLDKNVKTLTGAMSLLEQNYADPVSSEKALYQGAIPGMLRTLDPHSNFLDPNEFREMQRRQRSQYFGVGMEIAVVDENVIVNQPFPNSPAWKAGLRRGDVIAAVNGQST